MTTKIWRLPDEQSATEIRELGIDPDRLAKVEARFAQQIEEGLHPGAQLAVYRHGRRVVELGGGLARRSTAQPVTPETLFVLYSATKAWSLTAAHMLVEQGRLKLDEPVAAYWPEFGQHGKEAVTVGHVLSHRGGFPNIANTDFARSWDPDSNLEGAELEWEPGSANAYHYDAIGWTIAGLIRRIDGRDLWSFLRQEVFDPLALTDSYLPLPPDRPDLQDRVAYLYEMEPNTPGSTWEFSADPNPAVPEWRFAWNRPEAFLSGNPSGGGIASAGDLARFYGALANGGTIDDVRLLKPETVERAVQQTNRPGEIDLRFGMPMPWSLGFMLGGPPDGWRLGPTSTRRTFGHAGAGCVMGLGDLDRALGVAFATNGNWTRLPSAEHASEITNGMLEACR